MAREQRRRSPRGVSADDIAGDIAAPTPGALEPSHIAGLRLRHQAAARFLAHFPPEVCRSVGRLRRDHWALLALLARCPGAEELLSSNPALALAVAAYSTLGPPTSQPMRSARALIRRPRREILDHLGFPPAEWVVRLLAKVDPAALSITALLRLRGALVDGLPPKPFLHAARLGPGALVLLLEVEHRDLAGITLLADADRPRRDVRRVADWLRDAARMYAALHPGQRLPIQHSVSELRRLHDALAVRDRQRVRCAPPVAVLPPPPVPGTGSIVPITTFAELVAEGCAMHHCVASYASQVASGNVYVYRVLSPSRATLSLVRRGDAWVLDQLYGVCNAEVDPTTRQAVHLWTRAALGPRSGSGAHPG
ncbi:MAG: PcfJ domain-containing protein [Polyangiaceae bacterium]|nr:PcfJ domain-containing protein [Polyangiaceae bacterium]